MLVKKSLLVRIGITAPLLLLQIQPLRAQTSSSNSESERLQKLERAVEQLQKRNAELEQEVSSLKKQSTSEPGATGKRKTVVRSEEHTSELQSHSDLVCRLLLEKKKKKNK